MYRRDVRDLWIDLGTDYANLMHYVAAANVGPLAMDADGVRPTHGTTNNYEHFHFLVPSKQLFCERDARHQKYRNGDHANHAVTSHKRPDRMAGRASHDGARDVVGDRTVIAEDTVMRHLVSFLMIRSEMRLSRKRRDAKTKATLSLFIVCRVLRR
jgi:hypothetical protein